MSQLGTARFKNKKNQVTCSRWHSSLKAVVGFELGNEALEFTLRTTTQNGSWNQGPSSFHPRGALNNSWTHKCATTQQSLSTKPLLQREYTGSAGVTGLRQAPSLKNLPSFPVLSKQMPPGLCYLRGLPLRIHLVSFIHHLFSSLYLQPISLF